jgi:hypothetical protein
MSTDNGIYILRTVRNRFDVDEQTGQRAKLPYYVYRVAEAHAMDNFKWYEKNQPYNLGAFMLSIWGESDVFTTLESALEYAHKLEADFPILEYGISVIETEYFFFGDF